MEVFDCPLSTTPLYVFIWILFNVIMTMDWRCSFTWNIETLRDNFNCFSLSTTAFQNLTKGDKKWQTYSYFCLMFVWFKKNNTKICIFQNIEYEKEEDCSTVIHSFEDHSPSSLSVSVCPTCHRRQKEVFPCTCVTLKPSALQFWYRSSCQPLLQIYTSDLATEACTNYKSLKLFCCRPSNMMTVTFGFSVRLKKKFSLEC